MPSSFSATQLSVVVEHGVLVTTLGAPSTENDDFYLMLQHKEEFSPQDLGLGMDAPYIEYFGQGWSWYGHIENFELYRDRIAVQMDSPAAVHMGNDGHIEVTFTIDDTQFSALRSALRRTFHGHAYYNEVGESIHQHGRCAMNPRSAGYVER